MDAFDATFNAIMGPPDFSHLPPTWENLRNHREPTTMDVKLAAAKAWLASRPPHRYVPGVPTVLVPVAARYVQRVQERHGERRT